MPKDREIQSREARIAASHRRVADLSSYSNAYANFYEANPPEIHQLTTAQKMATKEYFTNPAFRAKKTQTEIKNFVASVAGLPADTAEAFWMVMQHAPKGVSDKPLPDFSPAIEAGTSRRLAESIGGDPDTVGFLLSQFVAPDPFGPVTGALAIGRVGGRNLNKIQDLATAEKMGLRETEFDIGIARETGWFRGMDGEVKLLLDDSQATVLPWRETVLNDSKVKKALEGGRGASGLVTMELENLLDFPELYEAYPMMRQLPIDVHWSIDPQGNIKVYKEGRGIGNLQDTEAGDLKRINIFNEENDYPFRETLMHEIEHAIQNIEGFARGGSSRVMREEVETLATAYERHQAMKAIEGGYDDPDKLYDRLKEIGFDDDTITLTVNDRYVNSYMGASNAGDLDAMDEILNDNMLILNGSADRVDFVLTNLNPEDRHDALIQLYAETRQNPAGLRYLFYRAYRNLKGEAEANFAGKTTGMQLEQLLNEGRLDARQYGKDPLMGFGENSPRTIQGQAQIVSDGATQGAESILPPETIAQTRKTMLKDEYIHGNYGIPARGPERSATQIKKADDIYWNRRRREYRKSDPDLTEDDIASMAYEDVERRVQNREAVGWMKHGVNQVELKTNLHGAGGPTTIDVLKNPTETEFTRWASKEFKDWKDVGTADNFGGFDEGPGVRVVTDVEDNVYVWNADKALHHDVIQATGMKYDWEADWTDVDSIDINDLFNQLVLGGVYQRAF